MNNLYIKSVLYSSFLSLLLINLSSCDKSAQINDYTIEGSNTTKKLVSALAGDYHNRQQTNILVKGGGSEHAIYRFLSGKIDFLNSSRKLTDEEIIQAQEEGNGTIKEIVFGLDAITIIVNPKNIVHELSVQQLTNIFEGKIKNWKEVGGTDSPIRIYCRNSASGTHNFVENKFVRNGFSKDATRLDSPEEVVIAVKKDVCGIAYSDISAITLKKQLPINGIWPLYIKIEGDESISPFQYSEVKNGNYPLIRPLYQYIRGEKRYFFSFISFELSKEGQKIVEEQGFLPIQPIHEQFNKQHGF